MKRYLLYLFVILSFIGMTSCDEFIDPDSEIDPDDLIEISDEFLNLTFFANPIEAQRVTFNTLSGWSATPSEEWIEVSTSTDESDDTKHIVEITLKENTASIERKAEILLSTGQDEKKILITQQARKTLSFENNRLVVSEEGGTVDAALYTDVDYIVSIPSNIQWVRQESSSGSASDTKMSLIVDPNTTTSIRECRITIENADSGTSDILVVEQNSKGAVILSQTYIESDYDRREIEIEIAPNTNYSLIIPTQAYWISRVITKSAESDIIKLKLEYHNSDLSRSAVITIDQNGTPHAIEIYQSHPEAIVLSDRIVEIAPNSTSVGITVKSDIDYEVILPAESWLRMNQQPEGALNRKMTFSIDENTDFSPRTAIVTIKDPISNKAEDVTINQGGVGVAKVNLENPGELSAKLGELYDDGLTADAIKQLVISGAEFNQSDFSTLKSLKNVVYLDMSKSATRSIPEKQFEYNHVIQQVLLPQGLGGIGMMAFDNCTNLTSVTLPEGLGHIGIYAFRKTALTKVTIPSTLIQWDQAFESCEYLTEAILSEGLTTISTLAFSASGLSKVTVPSTITSWEGAFMYCGNLTEVILSEGITSIDESAFLGSGLVSINIPSTIKTWGEDAFYECEDLTTVELAEGLTIIGREAFNDTGLELIKIPSSIVDWEWAFYLCKNLKQIELPEGLTTIPENSLNHSGLTSIKIPKSLKSWNSAFTNCLDLTLAELPEGLTNIGEYAFSGSGLTSIKIPSTIKIWGDFAFSHCKSLKTVELTEGLTIIGTNVFSESGIESIKIPSSITTWELASFGENAAFSQCDLLKTIELAEGVTTIGYGAFQHSGFKLVILPSTITRIENQAFYTTSASFDNPIKITLLSPLPPTIFENSFPPAYSRNRIYVPQTSLEAYKSAWSQYNYVIQGIQ